MDIPTKDCYVISTVTRNNRKGFSTLIKKNVDFCFEGESVLNSSYLLPITFYSNKVDSYYSFLILLGPTTSPS